MGSTTQCHINLWCLGGILGRTNFYWDVGLRIRGTDQKEIARISLALPFATDADSVRDLHDQLVDNKTAELVFGNPVSISGSVPNYDGSPVELGRIESPRLITQKSGQTHSLWEIGLAPPLKNSSELYIRLRFVLKGCGRTWVWKRSLWRKNGALLDLRVSDVREGVALSDWASLRMRIVPVDKLNLFVIAPAYLQARSISPELRYMRLLENSAWENYLGRIPNSSGERLIIYHWRSKDETKVDVNRPFLAFLDLTRDYGFVRFGNHVRASLIVVAVILLVEALVPQAKELWEKSIPIILANKVPSVVTAATVLTFICGVFDRWRWVLAFGCFVSKGVLRIEKMYLRSRGS
jgi:hypothetical protein